MTSRAVVIYSGGMDSFTLLSELYYGHQYDLFPVSFDYGQRHSKELDYARAYTAELEMVHKVVDVRSLNILMQGSALTSPYLAVPLGHYEEPSMKQTVVPNRNMVMLAMAIGYAVSIKAERVFCGVHAGDHAIYPDCRPVFIDKMNQVAEIANYEPVHIEAPYLPFTKGQILEIGLGMGLDYAKSWTCYNGRQRACGKCGACTERLEAFAQNRAVDPLRYEEAT